jgi:hypothetical protein
MLLVIGCLTTVQAATPDFYGFGSMRVESGDSLDYQWDWARFGVKAHPYSDVLHDSLLVRLEYDVLSSQMKYAYAQWDKKFGYNQFSIMVGQFLNPVQRLYPGPSSIPMPRWPVMQKHFSVYCPGISLEYQNEVITTQVAHFGEDQWATYMECGILYAAWEQDVGYSMMLKVEYEVGSITAGLTKYEHPLEDEHSYDNNDDVRFSLGCSFVPIRPLKTLRFHYHTDLGAQEIYTLMGLNWAYGQNSSIELFCDSDFSHDEGYHDVKWTSRLTFYFE